MSLLRYTRQARLAEVGEPGQAKLSEGEACIASVGVAAVVSARYAAGAGLGSLRVREPLALDAARSVDARMPVVIDAGLAAAASSLSPAWLAELDPGARDVAQGAYEALVAIRQRLGIVP
jgi:hypothetical protein